MIGLEDNNKDLRYDTQDLFEGYLIFAFALVIATLSCLLEDCCVGKSWFFINLTHLSEIKVPSDNLMVLLWEIPN